MTALNLASSLECNDGISKANGADIGDDPPFTDQYIYKQRETSRLLRPCIRIY